MQFSDTLNTNFKFFITTAQKQKKQARKGPAIFVYISVLLSHSGLSLGLKFGLKRLESSVGRDAESYACIRSDVCELGRVDIKEGSLLENSCEAL